MHASLNASLKGMGVVLGQIFELACIQLQMTASAIISPALSTMWVLNLVRLGIGQDLDETISRAVRSARLLAEKGKDTLVVFDTGFLHPSALSNRRHFGVRVDDTCVEKLQKKHSVLRAHKS
jgi:hypothetical protein